MERFQLFQLKVSGNLADFLLHVFLFNCSTVFILFAVCKLLVVALYSCCNGVCDTVQVRPFTLGQLKELLSRTGSLVEEGFWIDKIKSHCYVTVSY